MRLVNWRGQPTSRPLPQEPAVAVSGTAHRQTNTQTDRRKDGRVQIRLVHGLQKHDGFTNNGNVKYRQAHLFPLMLLSRKSCAYSEMLLLQAIFSKKQERIHYDEEYC